MYEVENLFIETFYKLIYIFLFVSLLISLVDFDTQKSIQKWKSVLLILLTASVSFLYGFRDLDVGVDTQAYNYIYQTFLHGEFGNNIRDPLWDVQMFLYTRFFDEIYPFLFCVALGYVLLPILGFQKYLKEDTLYFLLFTLISPFFFQFGANVIRSGLAASLFLFSFRYFGRKKQWVYILLSCFLHLSMLLPAVAYYISRYVRSILPIYIAWVLAILIVMVGVDLLALVPDSFSRLFMYVSASPDQKELSRVIFNLPISFWSYGILPPLLGFYFVVIKRYYDPLYLRLLATYLLANIVVIFLVQANIYVLRFEYLSGFLMPFLLVYPILQTKLSHKRFLLVSIMLVVFTLKSYQLFL